MELTRKQIRNRINRMKQAHRVRQQDRIGKALHQAETETDRQIIRKVLSNYRELKQRNKKTRIKRYSILGYI